MYSIFICCPYLIQSDSFAITWLKSAYNRTRLILLLAACFNRPTCKCITRSYKLIVPYSCLGCIHKRHFIHRTCCSITIRNKLYSIAVFLPVSCICSVTCRTCCYNYFFTCAIYACSTPACKRITFTHWCLKCDNTAVNLISTWVICFSTIQIICYLIYIFTPLCCKKYIFCRHAVWNILIPAYKCVTLLNWSSRSTYSCIIILCYRVYLTSTICFKAYSKLCYIPACRICYIFIRHSFCYIFIPACKYITFSYRLSYR